MSNRVGPSNDVAAAFLHRVEILDRKLLSATKPDQLLTEAAAVGFVLDEHHIGAPAEVGFVCRAVAVRPLVHPPPGEDRPLDKLVKLQVPRPCPEEHDLQHVVLIAPDAPDRAGRPAVLRLGGERGIEACDDELHVRICQSGNRIAEWVELLAVLGVELPPVPLDDAAATSNRHLLVLAHIGVGAERALEPRHVLVIESSRPRKVALIRARVAPSDRRAAMPVAVILHRDHQVLIAEAIAQDRPSHVRFMHPLHDDHYGAGAHVVEAVRHGLAEPPHRLGPDPFGLTLADVVGVVQENAITALAGRHAENGRGQLPPRLVVRHLGLANLDEIEPVLPHVPVARVEHQVAEPAVVALRQRRGVGEADIAIAGKVLWPPLPCRPERVGQQRLHEARRHRDQKPVDLPGRHRLKMLADRFKRPPLHQLSRRLYRRPVPPDEVNEALFLSRGRFQVPQSLDRRRQAPQPLGR